VTINEASPPLDADFRRFVDAEGRTFEYAVVTHPEGEGLAVHCSAFFGKWGDRRRYRDNFQGYFHRLRMLGSGAGHHWLFLCDAYGAYRNGTYYSGEHGDPFVERAILAIVDLEMERLRIPPGRLVTVGSSMGATGALVIGLSREAAGVVAIAPHIDLDVAASQCGRWDEVAFITQDGDPTAVGNYAITRRVRALLSETDAAKTRPLPGLFVQTCADDSGVYPEQVPPLVDEWRLRGGAAIVDLRSEGGHTSAYATRPLLLDAIATLMDGRLPDADRYQCEPEYAGQLTPDTIIDRTRQRLRLRSRIRALTRRRPVNRQ
jgi:hypothetical protein